VGGSLGHVVVCGGTTHEWSAYTASDWQRQLGVIAESLEGSGVSWVTLCPWGGSFEAHDRDAVLGVVESVTGGSSRGSRISFIGQGGVVCIVDVCTDGRTRFVDALNSLANDASIDEGTVESALFAPALADPDLILVFGPPTQLPPSLMWELAYSELVFLDTPWSQCNSAHVHMAIDDFQRRDRRFGGIDT
jgi:undecaprenyl diphosphate synthase